jgi:cell division protein FtsB
LQRKKKRVGLVAKVLIAAFAIYAACTLVDLQLRINAASAEQQTLSAQLNEQKLINAELNDAIIGENQEEYIAQIARESLGYIYPGEQVYVDISSK